MLIMKVVIVIKGDLIKKYGKKTEEEYLKEKKSKKKKPKAYWQRYDNKIVTVKLIDNSTFEGKLHTDLYNRYDILIELEDGKRILIPKHSVLYVQEKED